MDLYFFRWILVNFFSETRRILRAVNRASWWSRSISRYKFRFCLPAARRCSPWCQPSTSLLLLVAIMYTLQLEGGHVLLVIQISETYPTNCCSGAVVACCLRCWNIGGISCSGRNGFWIFKTSGVGVCKCFTSLTEIEWKLFVFVGILEKEDSDAFYKATHYNSAVSQLTYWFCRYSQDPLFCKKIYPCEWTSKWLVKRELKLW